MIVPFSILEEKDAHEKFADLRVRGEWFRAEPDLLEFIDDTQNTFRKTQGLPPLRRRNHRPTRTRDPYSIAREGVLSLGKQRPDLKYMCADLAANFEYQRKWPNDPDFKAAGVRLYREIERRTQL